MTPLIYSPSASHLSKVSTIKSKQLSTKRCYNVIVYFVQLKKTGYKAWREHWFGLILSLVKVWFKVYHENQTHL